MSPSYTLEAMDVADCAPEVCAFLYRHLYEPWGVTHDIDWLCAGDGGEFLVARDARNRVVGTVRIMPSDSGSAGHPTPPECIGQRRLRQVVVDPALRGHGLGSLLMRRAEQRVADQGIGRVGLAARNLAYGFYERCGYSYFGDEYISPLTHIPHRHMSKELR